MKTQYWMIMVFVSIEFLCGLTSVEGQGSGNFFEFPVQLVGFPVIIMAVRLANFVRKLAYSLNPRTYMGRSKRSLTSLLSYEDFIQEQDVITVEKRLVAHFGSRVCIYYDVCREYAEQTLRKGDNSLDWKTVFTEYKLSPPHNTEYHLLSMFLGEIVGSPSLCKQLAKRGLACKK